MNPRRLFRFKSIHTSIAIAFSCLIVAMTVLHTYNSYQLSEEAVTNNAKTYTEQLIDQVNTNIETYLDNMVSISDLVISNSDLERAASLSEISSSESRDLNNGISRFFRSVVRSREDIATIAFVGANGNTISDREQAGFKPIDDLRGQDWYKSATEAKGKVVISSSHVQHIYLREYRWVVSISRQLGEAGQPGSGVLMVDLNLNVINNLCKQIELGNQGYVFILDPSGDLIYHPRQQLLYSRLKTEEIPLLLETKDSSIPINDNDGQKIYTIRTNEFGWKLIGVTYTDELVGNKLEIRTTSVFAGILFLIVALSISIFLSYRLTNPIKRLESLMKKVEKGDFNTRVEVESVDEIGKLSRSFNLMIGKIKDLMGQILQEQEMKRISEFKAMQAQIHPHFLYNTLDSIIWMAEMGKMAEVVKMTSALAKLFRSSISKGDELVPISVELEHIHNYLTIQNIRYKNKFTYSIDVDPSIHENKTLKIVLQPLVENAIYHGLKQQAVIGHITITGKRESGDIVLQVIDDGVGMSMEQLLALRNKLLKREEGKGVGLENVNNRIRLYFGESYGLEIFSEFEEGTTIKLRIPEIR